MHLIAFYFHYCPLCNCSFLIIRFRRVLVEYAFKSSSVKFGVGRRIMQWLNLIIHLKKKLERKEMWHTDSGTRDTDTLLRINVHNTRWSCFVLITRPVTSVIYGVVTERYYYVLLWKMWGRELKTVDVIALDNPGTSRRFFSSDLTLSSFSLKYVNIFFKKRKWGGEHRLATSRTTVFYSPSQKEIKTTNRLASRLDSSTEHAHN